MASSLTRSKARSSRAATENPFKVTQAASSVEHTLVTVLIAVIVLVGLAYWGWQEQHALVSFYDKARALVEGWRAAWTDSAASTQGPKVVAACGDPRFAAITQTLLAISSGALGTLLAFGFLMMGGMLAVVKQSLTPAVTGVMGAVWISFAPTVMMTMVGC